jgi:hypothetical protein
MADAVKMIVEHGVFTREQIETSLGMNMQDVESLCGLPAGYLDTRVVRFQFRTEFGHDNDA